MIELTEAQRRFLVGLTRLTQETGVAIRGCGCCGSPFLIDAKRTSSESGYCCQRQDEDVTWVDPSDARDWERYRHLIVKDTVSETATSVKEKP